MLLLLGLASCHSGKEPLAEPKPYKADKDWASANGNEYLTRYSALDQIDKENVIDLEVAWI